MSTKLYLLVSGTVFLLVAILHGLRLVNHWPILVASWTMPYWVSYVGCPVSAGYCVWAGWLLARRD